MTWDLEEAKSVQFGAPRTGSTVVWQILNHVLGPTYKTHDVLETEKPIAISIRDPRDAMVSNWRVRSNVRNPTPIPFKDIKKYVAKYIDLFSRYNFFLERANELNVIWIRYELAFQNHDYIYDTIERGFLIEIPEEKRAFLRKECSLQRNYQISMQQKLFRRFDKKTHIHGNHILTGELGVWKKFIPEEHRSYVNNELGSIIEQWGYLD